MTAWSDISRATIAKVHASLPRETPLGERMAAVDAAYPFGPRSHWPYKAWCKARREYLGRHGYGRGRKPAPLLDATQP